MRCPAWRNSTEFLFASPPNAKCISMSWTNRHGKMNIMNFERTCKTRNNVIIWKIWTNLIFFLSFSNLQSHLHMNISRFEKVPVNLTSVEWSSCGLSSFASYNDIIFMKIVVTYAISNKSSKWWGRLSSTLGTKGFLARGRLLREAILCGINRRPTRLCAALQKPEMAKEKSLTPRVVID